MEKMGHLIRMLARPTDKVWGVFLYGICRTSPGFPLKTLIGNLAKLLQIAIFIYLFFYRLDRITQYEALLGRRGPLKEQ